MPYALCPMPYALRVPHLFEKGYNIRCIIYHSAAKHSPFAAGRCEI